MLAGAWALVFTVAAAGQTPAEKCRIEGTVLNASTGQPVRKARLSLMPGEGPEPLTGTTDAQGHYVLANIAPGAYHLRVSHDGFMPQQYGAKKPGEVQKGEVLELTAGAVKTKIDLQMTPLGAIMGHIRDEDGDPVRQVNVAVLAYGYGPSGKALQVRSESQTDAAGDYRVFDLPPGTYYLRAKPMSAQMPGIAQQGEAYSTVYYPNAPQPAVAAAINVAAGQEQRGVDFVLHPISTASIRGRVIKPAGGENCSVSLEGGMDEGDMDMGDAGGMMGTVGFVTTADPEQLAGLDPSEFMFPGGRKVDKDGKFEFRGIPIGSHSLSGTCSIGKQRYSTKLAIELESAGLENLELRPVGPSNVTGQIQIEGESKSKITAARVWLGSSGGDFFFFGGDDSADGADGKVAEDGTFSFHDVHPNIYHINVQAPPDLYLKSMMESSRDVRESGVDLTAGGMSVTLHVVLSANGGSIEGSVENGGSAKVTLIPSDPQRARSLAKAAVAGADGHFSFQAVAPGSYRLLAWEDVDVSAAMYDAEFRKPFEGKGQTVEVAEKQKTTAQLILIPKIEK